MSAHIGIIIVDDDPFVCKSLQTILNAQSDIAVMASGNSGPEAVRLFEELMPDILLMDIQMPEGDGLDAAERILAAHPEARIVFLTTFADDDYIVRALRLGAKGYLIKQDVADIAPALRSVAAGQNVLGGQVIDHMDSLMTAQGQNDITANAPFRVPALTDRENEIVELVAQGLDNREIAMRIFIGEGTVRNHISSILQKLDLKNRTQIAVYYYRTR